MKTEKYEPLIPEWAKAWSSASSEDFASIFTEDCVYEDVAAEHVCHGRGNLKEFFRQVRMAFPNFTITLTSRLIAHELASAEWTMTGTHGGDLLGLPATNKHVTLPGVSIFHIRSGKLQRCTDYYNMASMLKQLGV